MDKITNRQIRMVENVYRYVKEGDLHDNPDRYEIKKFEINPLEYGSELLELYIETGLKNDENTMASVFCRKVRQIFLGPNGGMKAYRPKTGGKLRGFHEVMIHGVRY